MLLPMSVLHPADSPWQHYACEWDRGRSETRIPMHAFCSPQKGSRFTWVGLLAWRGHVNWLSPSTGFRRQLAFAVDCLSLHLPQQHAEWLSGSDAPSLTVAEPRRTCTGLPCYARRGHPRRRSLYHDSRSRDVHAVNHLKNG